MTDTERNQLADAILQAFRGREDRVAAEVSPGVFNPFEMVPSIEMLAQRHLAEGPEAKCLGFYLMREDNTVLCAAIDIDNHGGENPNAEREAVAVAALLEGLGIKYLIERSQSGEGWHIWIRFNNPVKAVLVRRFFQHLIEQSNIGRGTEIYPRQDVLREEGLGNLIRYPLWGQSCFYQLSGPSLVPLSAFEGLTGFIPTTEEAIVNVLGWWEEISHSGGQDQIEFSGDLPPRICQLLNANPSSLLARRWMRDTSGMGDQSRSAIVQAIAVEFVRAYAPTDEIEAALRCWCERNDYEKGLRDRWLRYTVEKAYDMAVGRRESQSLSGHNFASLAHQYADAIATEQETIIGTGIVGLDASVQGIGLGELGVIAARPNQAKTAMLMQWMDHAALCGFPTLLISLEMSSRENSRRVLLTVGQMAPEEWSTEDGNKTIHARLQEHYRQRAPMYFVEGAEHIDRIESVIDQYVTDYGVQMVGLDYQGLAVFDRKRSEYDNQTEITKRLKKAARRNDIALLSLVQVSRKNETGKDPTLHDLKGSGEIEASADLVFLNRWPFKESKRGTPRHEYVVNIAKCRNRKIVEPRVTITFNDDLQKFS